MEQTKGGCVGSPGVDEPEMKLLRPEFSELFQKLHHDIEIIFPEASAVEHMVAAVGALMSMKIDNSVVLLKTPTKVMKMGLGGVILPGG